MLIHSNPNQQLWENVKVLNRNIFKVSIVSYVIFYVIDYVLPGFISNFFSINLWLWISIAAGLFVVIFDKTIMFESPSVVRLKIHYSVIMSLLAGLAIFLQIREYGSYALLLSLMSGIVLFIVLVYNNYEKDEL